MHREDFDYWSSRSLNIPEQDVPSDWVLETFSLRRKELRTMVDEGFISPFRREGKEFYDSTAIKTIAFILVLKRQMGVNMAGIEIILHLKKQIHWHISQTRKITRSSDR